MRFFKKHRTKAYSLKRQIKCINLYLDLSQIKRRHQLISGTKKNTSHRHWQNWHISLMCGQDNICPHEEADWDEKEGTTVRKR